MSGRLSGKVAIVTGASRGVGRAICIALAGEGATIALAARDQAKLSETARLVRQAGGQGEIVVTDLEQEESIKNLVRTAGERFGRLDILVNCAGVTHSAALEQTSTDDWQRCMWLNARAPFILCREALGYLREVEQGCIVNIGSIVAVKGYPLQSAYTASKHALRGMTMSLAEELRGSSVRVHLICSGGIDTEMVSRVRPDIKKDELIKPAEIAEMVVYLVTHKGNAVIDEFFIRRASAKPWFIS